MSCSARQVFTGEKASQFPVSHMQVSCQSALRKRNHNRQRQQVRDSLQHIHRLNFSTASTPAASEATQSGGCQDQVLTNPTAEDLKGIMQKLSRNSIKYFTPTITELSNPKQEGSCCTSTPSQFSSLAGRGCLLMKQNDFKPVSKCNLHEGKSCSRQREGMNVVFPKGTLYNEY